MTTNYPGFEGDMLIVRIQQESAMEAMALCAMLRAEQGSGADISVIGAVIWSSVADFYIGPPQEGQDWELTDNFDENPTGYRIVEE